MTCSIDNTQDIIDSRDVIKRIEELEGDREALQDALNEALEARVGYKDADDLKAKQEAIDEARQELTEWDESEDAEELSSLRELASQMENECEWGDGATLIREDHFEDYAQQLAEDIGAISNEVKWPYTCIDWEQAARELRMDYSCVVWGDASYWYRS